MARLAPVVSLAVAFFFGGTQGFLNPGESARLFVHFLMKFDAAMPRACLVKRKQFPFPSYAIDTRLHFTTSRTGAVEFRSGCSIEPASAKRWPFPVWLACKQRRLR
jgi:hypothetical protein